MDPRSGRPLRAHRQRQPEDSAQDAQGPALEEGPVRLERRCRPRAAGAAHRPRPSRHPSGWTSPERLKWSRSDVPGPSRAGSTLRWHTRVCSLPMEQAQPEQVAAWVQGHWGIENRLHWVRDVVFDEDRHQLRTRNGPEIMAALRNLATRPHPPGPRRPSRYRLHHQIPVTTTKTRHQATHPANHLNRLCQPPDPLHHPQPHPHRTPQRPSDNNHLNQTTPSNTKPLQTSAMVNLTRISYSLALTTPSLHAPTRSGTEPDIAHPPRLAQLIEPHPLIKRVSWREHAQSFSHFNGTVVGLIKCHATRHTVRETPHAPGCAGLCRSPRVDLRRQSLGQCHTSGAFAPQQYLCGSGGFLCFRRRGSSLRR